MTSPELIALKQRQLALQKEKLALIKSYGLLSYKPHAKQEAFHQAGDKKKRLLVAGNRFGKSQMGCAEDCAWLIGERAWVPESSPYRKLGIPQHPVKGLLITTDFDKVDEIWTGQGENPGKLWKMLPKGFVKRATRNQAGVIDDIECHNGAVLRFDTVKSYQNNPLSSESSDWDFIHVDEPCPEKMYKAAARGLMDRNGSTWFTLTPLREIWITDMFHPRDKKTAEENEVTSRWVLRGSTYDNPYLSREAIAEYESTLTEDEKQCRLYGFALELAGLIYKEFNTERHVLKTIPLGWSAYNKPPLDYTIYAAMDVHPQTPHAVLFCAVAPTGQCFFFTEIFEHVLISELAAKYHVVVVGYYVPWTKCDPLAYITDPITGSSIAEELYNHGVFIEKATKDLSTGILRTKEALKKQDYYYFSPELFETLYEFQRYTWDEDNRPLDKYDHMMENLYRLTLSGMKWIDRAKVTNMNKPVQDLEIGAADFSLDDLGGIE